MNKIAPPVLCNKIKFVHEGHGVPTRAAENEDLVIPDIRNNLCRKNLFYLGFVNWNSFTRDVLIGMKII